MSLKSAFLSILAFGGGFAAGYFTCKKLLIEQYKEDVEDVRRYFGEREAFDQEYKKKVEVYKDSVTIDVDEEEDDSDIYEGVASEEETAEYVKRLVNEQLYSSDKGRPMTNYNNPSLDKYAQKLKDSIDNANKRIEFIHEDEHEEFFDDEDDEEFFDDEDDEDSEEETEDEYEARLEAEGDAIARKQELNRYSKDPQIFVDGEELREAIDYSDDLERETLYFYKEDRVVCDDFDAVVEDVEDVLGVEFEDVLRTQKVIWVKNPRLGMFYEVHWVDGNFSREVLYAAETPKEREERLKRRKGSL